MTTPVYIIEYAGAPVRFSQGALELVDVLKAERFMTEPDAWLDARAQGLNLNHCAVRNITPELNALRGGDEVAAGRRHPGCKEVA